MASLPINSLAAIGQPTCKERADQHPPESLEPKKKSPMRTVAKERSPPTSVKGDPKNRSPPPSVKAVSAPKSETHQKRSSSMNNTAEKRSTTAQPVVRLSSQAVKRSPPPSLADKKSSSPRSSSLGSSRYVEGKYVQLKI